MARLLDALVGDAETAQHFSDAADLAAMVRIESELALAQAETGLIPRDAGERIAAVCRDFRPDPDRLAESMAVDGVVVPALVRELRQAVGEPHGKHVHHGATSQDIVDTSLVLRLAQALDLLADRLSSLVKALRALKLRDGEIRLMAHTRMQQALPFTAADKLESWIEPLARHEARLAQLRPRILVVQLGGPIGLGMGEAVTVRLAERLGLAAGRSWHSQRDGIAEVGAWLSLVSGSLGKIGQDIALMAQNEVASVRLAGGGASSAMPHKSNPVAAEILVALARLNATLLGGLHQALVHENERSGAAWTLEWMLLPQMAVATAAALRHGLSLAESMSFSPAPAGDGPAERVRRPHARITY
jgi:3-carboxy-cis,cis-muconate cycloisomerase